ncbi:MAG: D-2-hydroxyacid dehydrogenase [Verrucomicrobiota bacterium]
MNILLYRDLPASAADEVRAIAPHAQVRIDARPAELPSHLPWADAIFGNPPASALLTAPRLRWLQIVSSGIDEYHALTDSGIQVTTAHGIHAPTIAQHTLMTILMLARAQLHFTLRQHEARWDRSPSLLEDVRGQTVGFIGYGAVGRELVHSVAVLGMRARAVKRTPALCPPELEQLDTLAGLDDLLAASDHIVISLPLTAETRGLLDAARIACIKRGACLHNIARGGLLDEEAVRARLLDGSLRGAAMDVFATEPLPSSSPWWATPNCIVTPHLAGHHSALGRLAFERFLRNLARHLAGDSLVGEANFARQY